MIGKVTRVEDAEVNVEIAPSVNVRVVKSMIAEVRKPHRHRRQRFQGLIRARIAETRTAS